MKIPAPVTGHGPFYCEATGGIDFSPPHRQPLISSMRKLNIQYAFYLGLGSLIQRMNIQQARSVGCLVGEMIWKAAPGRRQIAIQALMSHLGINKLSATRIARRNFRHTGISFVEMFLSRQIDFRFTTAHVSCNQEKLFQDLIARKRPIVATTGHLGSWELLAPILALYFRDRHRQIIVKHPKDKALAQVMTHHRGVGRNEIIGKDQAAPSVLRCLYENGVSAFLVDHNAQRNKSIFLPFLGEKASVNIGPAVLAIRSKALVCPIFLIRDGCGKYVLDVHHPLDSLLLEGKIQDKVRKVAGFYTHAVQKMVQSYPEQWFWMHKRWKTRPWKDKEDHLYAE